MGILIKIRKIYEKNNTHYYKIITEDYTDKPSAYVSLDSRKKEIIFFDENLNLLKKIDRYSDKPIAPIPGISKSVIGYVIIKTASALDKNEFPDILDYFA